MERRSGDASVHLQSDCIVTSPVSCSNSSVGLYELSLRKSMEKTGLCVWGEGY